MGAIARIAIIGLVLALIVHIILYITKAAIVTFFWGIEVFFVVLLLIGLATGIKLSKKS
ncbi:MAG: hypothetical protein V4543_10050 [Bacteroidota bacterium]